MNRKDHRAALFVGPTRDIPWDSMHLDLLKKSEIIRFGFPEEEGG